ncbi:MAG TPA: Gfo/Idh/MocA family oxidoreductase [Chthonomonadales bacterium]|nr:Gfo/Idh/MocA family oxidoreductase [Chthonomonadales bacterium]
MGRVRVAIVGQGRSGRDIHAAHLRNDAERFEIVAAVDALPERRERAAAELGCEAFASHEPLLGRRDIDLVVNAGPSRCHVPLTLELLEAGFHVLCEKPLASRVADVDRLAEAARRAGRVLAVFQQARFSPAFRRMQEVVGSGLLGELVQVNMAFGGFSRRYDWQTLRSEMGGALLNAGPHPLDQALQLLGEDAAPEVRCWMRLATALGDAEDHVLVVLTAPGRPIVQVEVSGCRRIALPNYAVCATRGGLSGSLRGLEWTWYDAATAPPVRLATRPLAHADGTPAYGGDALEWRTDRWQLPEGFDAFGSMSAAYYDMLHRTLTEGSPLEVTVEQVRRQVAIIEECQRQNPRIYPPEPA